MKKSLLYFVLVSIMIGCTPQEKPTTEVVEPKSEGEIRDELYQQVIEIHDVAMLKMETIMKLKNLSINRADSIIGLEDESKAGLIVQLEESQARLEEANKSMMMWMRGFRPPSDTVAHNIAMDYLRAEQEKIAEVNNQMDEVIEAAKAL